MKSGRFVLRIPPELHEKLEAGAAKRGTSLNGFVLHLLESSLRGRSPNPWRILQEVFRKELLGVVLFGSTARGDHRKNSDIDVLVVLDESVPIHRGLYRKWDEKVLPHLGATYSPQFTHLPKDLEKASGLWLEVSLDGEIQVDNSRRLRHAIHELKMKILNRQFIRKYSYGQPYWVQGTSDAE